jgi:hypothetical protein
MSRFGLRLVTLALDENNQWYRQAGSFEFEVRLVNDPRLSYSLLIRSDEMAFSQLFQWNASNPMFVVEDINKAIVSCSLQFIERHKQRKTISSIDLQEMLNHPIIPPPQAFNEVMGIRIQRGLNLNTAVQEGLWISNTEPTTPVPHSSPTPPTDFPQPVFSTPHSPPPQNEVQAPHTTPSWTIGAG